MVILGLLLVLAALVVGVLAFYALPTASSTVSYDIFGNQLSINPLTIFFSGVVAALLLLLGLWLLSVGAKKSARRSKELRDLRRDQKEQAKLDEQRAKEQARLAEQRNREQVAAAEREQALRDAANRNNEGGSSRL